MTNKKELIHTTELRVRFNEVDALGIVWHGHYVKFCEDGREAFGAEYGLGYLEVHKHGFATPIVNINIDFKRTVAYGESLLVETKYIYSPAAKIIFEYTLYRKSNKEVVAKGKSTQVFFNLDKTLYITNPPFYEEWKNKYFNEKA